MDPEILEGGPGWGGRRNRDIVENVGNKRYCADFAVLFP